MLEFGQINQQIEEAQNGVLRLSKINAMIEKLEDEKSILEKKVTQLQTIMDKEEIDVKKLENKSLANIFYSILGNLEEREEKERKEALAARLKYDQGVRELTGIKRNIAEFRIEKEKYVDCETRYKELYHQKQTILLQSNSKTGQRILDISEEVNISKNKLKEIREAVDAGEEVLYSLNNALKSLGSAGNWGTWDMLGGGLLSDLAKHSHIDNAKVEVEHSQTLLRQFRTELTDIEINENISIETDGFGKFADIFFDGLFADWFMQSKIHNSQDSVVNVKNQVQNVLHELEKLEQEVASNIEKLEQEWKDIIMKA